MVFPPIQLANTSIQTQWTRNQAKGDYKTFFYFFPVDVK